MDVQVLGYRELDGALAQLPEALRRQVVLAALKKAAAPMVRDAKASARRGKDPRRRGSMKQRKSGESEAIGHGADSIAARAAQSDSPYEAVVAVGPDARHWYMKFLEFGTARESPQRFLTPAFEVTKDAAVRAVGEELWKSLEATAARLSRQAVSGSISPRAAEALRE